MSRRRSSGGLSVIKPYIKKYRVSFFFVFCLIVASVTIDLAQPYMVKVAIDRYIAVQNPNAGAVAWMASVYLGLIVFSYVLTYYQNIFLQRTGQSIVREVRVDLFTHIQSLSMRFYDDTPAGRIITNVVNDTEALNTFFTQLLSITLRGGLSLILILFFMLRLDRTIALYCFLLVPLMVLLSYSFRRILRKIYWEIRSMVGSTIAFLAENLHGMPIVQIFNQEGKQEEQYDDKNRALLKAALRESRTSVLFNTTSELIGDLAVAALVWVGARSVIRGVATFGVLYAFIGYIRRFFQPINNITQQLNTLQSTLVAAERIAKTMQERPDIMEPAQASAPPPRGTVKFDHISLEYRPGQTVLNDISLEIQPGEKVGFVGASGAGKSSLMNLLARFYDATEGSVIINGKDVRDWPMEALRRSIGIVQQNVTLFSGSILDNIRFFRKDVSEERVQEACRLIGAEPFILKLPQGYDTMLSERAGMLSAGERQLLSIARVLVFKPEILILDEATASLDSVTEAVLHKAICQVSIGRTLLVIAHRLSTVREMDYIVVLDLGKMVERGAHLELLQRKGHYWQLHQSGIFLEAAL